MLATFNLMKNKFTLLNISKVKHNISYLQNKIKAIEDTVLVGLKV